MAKLAIIGYGNMASAIAAGILNSGILLPEDIAVFDTDSEKIAAAKTKNMVTSTSALQAVESAKFILFAVKPQVIDGVLGELGAHIDAQKVVISIAAGVSVEHYTQYVKSGCAIVRTMPNTPLMLGCGVTAIARPDNISDIDYRFVKSIFSAVGSVYEIPCDKFNEVIPVNSSSPAFIYLFAKVVAEAASRSGLSFDSSLRMIAETFIGSAEMLLNSGLSADELIKMVSSPGGTTIAALDAMDKNGFSEAIEKGIEACTKRAYELGSR